MRAVVWCRAKLKSLRKATNKGDAELQLVPFNEVLLTEYETNNPPSGIREKVEAYLGHERKDRAARQLPEMTEAEENEARTRAFFTALVRTQQEAARREFTRRREKYRAEYKVDESLADRAAVEDTFGFIRDEYERQRRRRETFERASESDAGPPRPEEPREGSPQSREEIREELRRKKEAREKELKDAAFREWRRTRGVNPPPRGNNSGGLGSAGTPPTPTPGDSGGTGGDSSSGGSSGGGGVEAGNGGAGDGEGGGGGGIFATPREAMEALGRAQRSALCLSGGGIRSATFNLGILQGLARHGLLEEFDYLSTVSGGGFIGGWLTAWLHRQSNPDTWDEVAEDELPGPGPASDVQRVVARLRQRPKSPLDPEPAPIKFLRVFSNYLSPQTGLLSADTWTLVSTLVRNLLLTWLVFVPFLLLVLLVPRGWAAFLNYAAHSGYASQSRWVGMVLAWIALGFIGLALSWPRGVWPRRARPAAGDMTLHRNSEWPFLVFCLLPGVAAAAAFATYWKCLNTPQDVEYGLGSFLWFAILLLLVPWGVTLITRLVLAALGKGEALAARFPRKTVLPRLVLATLVIALAQVVTGCLLYVLSQSLYDLLKGHDLAYVTLSVPIIICALGLDCILVAGFTSTLVPDEDMEWWARAGAWFMIAVVGWAAVNALVLFGPELFLTLGATLRQASRADFWTPEKLRAAGQLFAVGGGLVSLVITLVGGFSAKTPAHGKEEEAGGAAARLLGVLAGLLAPVSLAFILILLALGTNFLLEGIWKLVSREGLPSWLSWFSGADVSVWRQNGLARFDEATSAHAYLVKQTSLRLLLLTGAAVGLVGFVLGLLINSNKFSLHYMWRNRIVRAYLGASNKGRSPESFVNFDPFDDIHMCDLRERPRPADGGAGGNAAGAAGGVPPLEDLLQEELPALPRKLFHVLNVALNLAGGDNLAWQDRKAESFTISKLHCGSYWLGYRNSSVFCGEDGITLGTAVAISGAFVSPNMGYMMTSPVVRFLMTLFNVRFGWWVGNPGLAGDREPLLERLTGVVRSLLGRKSAHPFESASPALSVLPIVAEAFGKTDDRSPYVYLSDGGHFENLGLYEMVLRRCRFIVVSDASTDSGYSFDSLGQSIRQIRVDLGIPIELTDMSIIAPSDDLRGKYCAVGRIRYSCVDRDAADPDHLGLKDEDFDGTLIYIKASMIGEEPRDVVNYGRGSDSFPQEVIVDQWFSEAQFESYRALGSHIIDTLCGAGLGQASDRNRVELPEFEAKARRHNQLNFRVFKERASYAALVNEFRRLMRTDAAPEYRSRVREYFKSLVG